MDRAIDKYNQKYLTLANLDNYFLGASESIMYKENPKTVLLLKEVF